jgi:hypothetical protein
MGKWRYNVNILDLGTRQRLAVSFTAQSIYPRDRSSRYPLGRRLGGPRTGPDTTEKRKIPCLCLESNLGRPARSYTDSAIPAPLYYNKFPIIMPILKQSKFTLLFKLFLSFSFLLMLCHINPFLGSGQRAIMEVLLEVVFSM